MLLERQLNTWIQNYQKQHHFYDTNRSGTYLLSPSPSPNPSLRVRLIRFAETRSDLFIHSFIHSFIHHPRVPSLKYNEISLSPAPYFIHREGIRNFSINKSLQQLLLKGFVSCKKPVVKKLPSNFEIHTIVFPYLPSPNPVRWICWHWPCCLQVSPRHWITAPGGTPLLQEISVDRSNTSYYNLLDKSQKIHGRISRNGFHSNSVLETKFPNRGLTRPPLVNYKLSGVHGA